MEAATGPRVPTGSANEPAEQIEISVVMPCLNEAEGVARCIEKALSAIDEMGVAGEVVVVDNGSTDGSPEIAQRAGARVVHEHRRGYGAAYQRGFSEARGRYIVMGDADDTYDFTKIEDFITPLREGFELVMGDRLKGNILPGAMPWTHRWIGNPILSGLLRLFFHTRISDSHCGMRSFTRQAIDKMDLRTSGMEFASEIVVKALRVGLKIHEIPITYHPRIGESKLSGLRDAWRHVRFMLLFSPSYLFQLPGLLLIGLGAVLVLALAGGPRVIFGHRWDYHPLLFGSTMLILGFNLVVFDIAAKAFSMGAGLANPRQWLRRLLDTFSLEKGLILGALIFAAGLGIEIKIVYEWIRNGYPELMAVRGVTIGMTAMVLGLQTVFASFLVGLMQIRHR